MAYIDSQKELETFCRRLNKAEYICFDTEFMRERTFFPQLCLIQLSIPIKSEETGETIIDCHAVDPLAKLDLKPLLEILTSDKLLILHSGKQDLEIIYNLTGKLPKNVFDTQIAAMVCGFGEQVSYQELVREFSKTDIDKSQRFTDWSKRPLNQKQIDYALADVAYLPEIHARLSEKISTEERKVWLKEEESWLLNPKNYAEEPEESWQRIKHRDKKNSHLGVLQEVAAWRDKRARSLNKPRRWIMKDESLVELALRKPQTAEDLLGIRNIGNLNKTVTKELLDAVKRGLDMPKEQIPVLKKRPKKSADPATLDLLKLLFRLKAAESKVAAKLLGTTEDIEKFALGTENPFAEGWRHEIFGRDATKLLAGELAVSVDAKTGKIKLEPTKA